MTDASQADRQYMDLIRARMKQQQAMRSANEAPFESAKESAQLGPSASALGKRPAQDWGADPGWVSTFTQDQYNDLGQQMTKLKSDYEDKELECQRKLTELRQTHEENMTDTVAAKVMEALTAKSVKRGETMDVVAEAMVVIEAILKTKGNGHMKIARGIVRCLNPNLITRHTLRSVCHTFRDLYTLLEVNFSAHLPDIGLLESGPLAKERIADYFRVNLCPYAGDNKDEAEEEFCTTAFGMQLYKNVGGLRLYLTEEGRAAGVPGGGDEVIWEIDDGTALPALVPIPPSESAPMVTFSEPLGSGGLPPGWVTEERMPSSGRAYKIYRGPNGEYAESKRQACRLMASRSLVGASVAPECCNI